MKQLVILPFMPAANARQAGHRLSFDIIKNIRLTNEVHLFLIVRPHECQVPPELSELCGNENIHVAVIENPSVILNWLASGIDDYFRFVTRYTSKISKELVAYCSSNQFSVVRFEFSQTFKYVRDLIDSGCQAKIHISIHDLQIQVILRKNNLESLLLRWAYRTEKKMLAAADEIFVLSEKDKVFVQYLLDIDTRVTVVPPSLSSFVYNICRIPDKVEKNTLLFWGAMGRVENESAVLFFVENILKKLRSAGYMYKLYVVGSNPGKKIQELACAHICVTGFLEDPSSYFEKSSIGVVPLSMGAGVKLKTLELLQAGLTVLASPVGAEGIPVGNEKLIVADIASFEQELVRMYEK